MKSTLLVALFKENPPSLFTPKGAFETLEPQGDPLSSSAATRKKKKSLHDGTNPGQEEEEKKRQPRLKEDGSREKGLDQCRRAGRTGICNVGLVFCFTRTRPGLQDIVGLFLAW